MTMISSHCWFLIGCGSPMALNEHINVTCFHKKKYENMGQLGLVLWCCGNRVSSPCPEPKRVFLKIVEATQLWGAICGFFFSAATNLCQLQR